MRTLLLFASVLSFAAAGSAAPTDSQAAAFDIAPFGFRMAYDDGKAHGVRWAEPRKVRRVVVEFDEDQALPESSQVRLEYWHRVWDGKADPLIVERGAGGVGWDAMDDWTNGRWVAAEGPRRADRQRLRIHLRPYFRGRRFPSSKARA